MEERSLSPPPTLGQRLTLTIQDLAFGGEGVGRWEGWVVFVPDTVPGDVVEVEVVEVRRRFLRAKGRFLLKPSRQRTVPLCRHFGTCGGCHWQMLEEGAEERVKAHIVQEHLERIARLPSAARFVRPLPPTLSFWGYRHKVEWHFFPTGQGWGMGYHQRNPDRLFPAQECPILHPMLWELTEGLRSLLARMHWSAYDARTGEGLLRSLALRVSSSRPEATMLLITAEEEVPHLATFLETLFAEEPRIVGFVHRVRERDALPPLGRRVGEVVGRPLVEEVPLVPPTDGEPSKALRFEISPDAFFQTDPRWLPWMWGWVEEALQPREGSLLFDLYSGVGTFALPLAQRGCEVWALEESPEAVEDARRNAIAWGEEKVHVERGRVEDVLPLWLHRQRPQGAVLDPPRAGCQRSVLAALAKARVPRLAYVSCDSATLARDLRILLDLGYRLEWVQPFNLFPRTYHIECVAALSWGSRG